MKLYKISQDINHGYDTYDSIVVCAENEEKAKQVMELDEPDELDSWVTDVKDLTVEYIGEARDGMEEDIICSSFNAG